MQMRVGLLFLVLTISSLYALPENIEIRQAREDDLEGLCALDAEVSWEYFKPLYERGYAHLDLGKNPEHYLNLELEYDKNEYFPACIQGQKGEVFLVASDRAKDNAIVGLAIGEKKSDVECELSLLLLEKSYRRNGIGRSLIERLLTYYTGFTSCVVTPIRYENDETLAFYQALGFQNQGVPQTDEVNIYGIRHDQMYLKYVLLMR